MHIPPEIWSLIYQELPSFEDVLSLSCTSSQVLSSFKNSAALILPAVIQNTFGIAAFDPCLHFLAAYKDKSTSFSATNLPLLLNTEFWVMSWREEWLEAARNHLYDMDGPDSPITVADFYSNPHKVTRLNIALFDIWRYSFVVSKGEWDRNSFEEGRIFIDSLPFVRVHGLCHLAFDITSHILTSYPCPNEWGSNIFATTLMFSPPVVLTRYR
ncbi:hypothetical protein DL96DRAFT_655734 [Flagelloscypha sp. PMI_526]|nr:hypothetical protein DL96DRAFT_655734 [Flagelloscypha sp. PMI_526]